MPQQFSSNWSIRRLAEVALGRLSGDQQPPSLAGGQRTWCVGCVAQWSPAAGTPSVSLSKQVAGSFEVVQENVKEQGMGR